jgi:tRNA G18 (ribose-2'-O)-methylase SpoU
MSTRGVRLIESGQNPLMKTLRSLHSARGIRKEGLALLAGARLVQEAGEAFPERVAGWITSGDAMAPPPSNRWTHYRLAPALFRELDTSGTHTPLLLLRVPEIPPWDPAGGLPAGLSLLVPFQDPENVGAVLRAAAAFGADRAILLEECAHPYHPKALRASGGTVLRVPLRSGPPLASLPEDLGLTPLSAEGTDLARYRWPSPCGLLLGTEGMGLPEAWRRRAVGIPIREGVDSLNAAAAAAIALYAWSRGPERKASGRGRPPAPRKGPKRVSRRSRAKSGG